MAYRPSGLPSFSGLASDPAVQQKMRLSDLAYNSYVQQQKDAAKKQFLTTAALGSAGMAAGPLLGGLGAAASPAATGVGGAAFSSAPLMSAPAGASVPAAAGKFGLNSLLSLGQLGASLFGSITGQHAQTKATTAAQLEQQREFDIQQRMLAEQQAADKAEKDRLFTEQQRQWEAQQKLVADQFRASEEDRMRKIRLEDEAEARKAPRRAASAMALSDLLALIGRGR